MAKRRSERIIGYLRVSTDEQAASGLGLSDQRAAIEAEAARRGWSDVSFITDDGFSAKNLARPGITDALAEVRAAKAGTLVVAKLDRLSRSLMDFASLMDKAQREGWELVALDLGVDTSTPSGEMMASIMATFAQYERRLIGQRTSAALQQLKRQGKRLGRPVQTPSGVRDRIVSERHSGKTLQAIAEGLNDEGLATVRGGIKWYASTVKSVLTSAALDEEATACSAA